MSKDIVTSHGFETNLARYLFVISHGFPLFLRVKRGLSISVDVRRLDSYCVAKGIYWWEDGGDGQRDHLWVGSSTPLDTWSVPLEFIPYYSDSFRISSYSLTFVLFPCTTRWGLELFLGREARKLILRTLTSWGWAVPSSSSCEFIFLWGCLPVRSSSCEFVFLQACLPVRLSSSKVVFQ